MIVNIFKSILKNIQFFLVTWAVIIIANQSVVKKTHYEAI